MLCAGCPGDKNVHWDSSCWILVCCVDDKGLSNCSEYDQFPRLKLAEWSDQNDGYRRAFEKLKAIHAGK